MMERGGDRKNKQCFISMSMRSGREEIVDRSSKNVCTLIVDIDVYTYTWRISLKYSISYMMYKEVNSDYAPIVLFS